MIYSYNLYSLSLHLCYRFSADKPDFIIMPQLSAYCVCNTNIQLMTMNNMHYVWDTWTLNCISKFSLCLSLLPLCLHKAVCLISFSESKMLQTSPALGNNWRYVFILVHVHVYDLFFRCFCFQTKSLVPESFSSKWSTMAKICLVEIGSCVPLMKTMGMNELFIALLILVTSLLLKTEPYRSICQRYAYNYASQQNETKEQMIFKTKQHHIQILNLAY